MSATSKNKTKNPFGGGIAKMDLSSISDINQPVPANFEIEEPKVEKKNHTIQKPKVKREIKKNTPGENVEKKNEGNLTLNKSKRQRILDAKITVNSSKEANKQINFSTDFTQVEKFKSLTLKYFLANPNKENRINYSEMFTKVLQSMENSYDNVIPATEDDLAFYKKINTKSFDHQDLDIILQKAKLIITLSPANYDLTYNLMNTYFRGLPVKPTRYSVNFFFFEFVRFFEANFKNI